MLLFFLAILLIGWVFWFGEYQRIAKITPLEQTKEKDFNKTSTTFVIDDYNDFVNDCLEKTKPSQKTKRPSINLQELRHKEKLLHKRRILNKIAKRSRAKNRKK